MRILLVAATTTEIAPLIKQLQIHLPEKRPGLFSGQGLQVSLCISGVGMLQTTYAVTEALHRLQPDFALQAGVAGAFGKKLPIGAVAVIGEEITADLGAEDHDRFLDLFELGLATDEPPFSRQRLINPLTDLPAPTGLPVVSALTVHCASGSRETINRRQQKYACTLESMEGAAFHFVCLKKKIPFLQVRCVSNEIVPRDKSTWRLETAIKNLNQWLIDYVNRIEASLLSPPGKVD